MVDSQVHRNGHSQAADFADLVAAEAERQGLSRVDVVMALLQIEKNGKADMGVQGSLPGWPTDPDQVFDSVPEGFVTLPCAARQYSLNRQTVRNWVNRGHLRVYGRLKGSAQGGGFILLNEDELQQLLQKKGEDTG